MNDDRTFLNDKINASPAALPETLGAENVSALVQGETQKKKKRRYPAVLASLAAVLALLIGVGAVMRTFGSVRVIRNLAPSRDIASTSSQPVPQAQIDGTQYAGLGDVLSKNLSETYNGYSRRFIFGWGGTEKYSFADEDVVAEVDAMPSTSAVVGNYNGADQSADSYAQLNTRTEGVDETDMIRTDGKYIYVLNHRTDYYYGYYRYYFVDYAGSGDVRDPQTLKLIAPNGGDMAVAGEYMLTQPENIDEKTKKTRAFTGFYLYGDRVILTGTETRITEGEVGYNEEEQGWDLGTDYDVEYLSVVLILDCSDPANITPVKELYYDGYLNDTRLIGDRLLTVSGFTPDAENFNAEDYTTFVPRAGEDGCYLPMDRIMVENDSSSSYVVVSVTALENAYDTRSVAVLGGSGGLYVSENNLYCYGTWYEETSGGDYQDYLCLSKVDVSGYDPVYKATGKYKGVNLFDSYSIDEYNGYVRMAVQSWGRWDALNTFIPAKSYVVVLDEALSVVGQSKSFGEDENIRSVRFSGDTGYVVTFLNTDPLFVFDLSDPANPVIKGEAKLPGYSAYMHPAGDGYMLGVGYDGTETGLNGDGKISLFDVSDPENPMEVDRILLKNGCFDTDYKSFITKDGNGFIVTFSTWSDDYSESGCGAVYFTVENGAITVVSRSEVLHSAYGQRALFIGNELYLYTRWDEYSEKEEMWTEGETLYSFRLSTGEKIAELAL